MNTKLLAGIAVFVLLAAIVSVSLTDSAFAEEKKDKAKKVVKEKVKKEVKVKKDAKPKAMKEAKPKAMKEMKEMKEKKTSAPSGTAAKDVTVEMAKGTASDQNCADKCFMPSTVSVAVGGKVTWKNMDSAAHTATATDSSFDTSLVNAGASASNTFSTAGSYAYMCILHPWMKGTVDVQ